MCGREYDTQRYVNRNLSGFDLLKERKKVFHLKFHEPYAEQVTIGIPAALHLFEDLPFWRKFFDALSIGTITSENYNDALKVGKHVADAEFCAPMVALHGHVQYLVTRSDAVFLPFYLEKKPRLCAGCGASTAITRSLRPPSYRSSMKTKLKNRS